MKIAQLSDCLLLAAFCTPIRALSITLHGQLFSTDFVEKHAVNQRAIGLILMRDCSEAGGLPVFYHLVMLITCERLHFPRPVHKSHAVAVVEPGILPSAAGFARQPPSGTHHGHHLNPATAGDRALICV